MMNNDPSQEYGSFVNSISGHYTSRDAIQDVANLSGYFGGNPGATELATERLEEGSSPFSSVPHTSSSKKRRPKSVRKSIGKKMPPPRAHAWCDQSPPPASRNEAHGEFQESPSVHDIENLAKDDSQPSDRDQYLSLTLSQIEREASKLEKTDQELELKLKEMKIPKLPFSKETQRSSQQSSGFSFNTSKMILHFNNLVDQPSNGLVPLQQYQSNGQQSLDGGPSHTMETGQSVAGDELPEIQSFQEEEEQPEQIEAIRSNLEFEKQSNKGYEQVETQEVEAVHHEEQNYRRENPCLAQQFMTAMPSPEKEEGSLGRHSKGNKSFHDLEHLNFYEQEIEKMRDDLDFLMQAETELITKQHDDHESYNAEMIADDPAQYKSEDFQKYFQSLLRYNQEYGESPEDSPSSSQITSPGKSPHICSVLINMADVSQTDIGKKGDHSLYVDDASPSPPRLPEEAAADLSLDIDKADACVISPPAAESEAAALQQDEPNSEQEPESFRLPVESIEVLDSSRCPEPLRIEQQSNRNPEQEEEALQSFIESAMPPKEDAKVQPSIFEMKEQEIQDLASEQGEIAEEHEAVLGAENLVTEEAVPSLEPGYSPIKLSFPQEDDDEEEQILNIQPSVLAEKPVNFLQPAIISSGQIPKKDCQQEPDIIFGVYKENYDIFNLRSAENSPVKNQSPLQQPRSQLQQFNVQAPSSIHKRLESDSILASLRKSYRKESAFKQSRPAGDAAGASEIQRSAERHRLSNTKQRRSKEERKKSIVSFHKALHGQ